MTPFTNTHQTVQFHTDMDNKHINTKIWLV